MHRNEHGVNLDLGLPLQTEADFRLLHVSVALDEFSSFAEWILSGEGLLLLGVQIGVGKSTFIQAGYRAVDRRPLVQVHFDTDASAQTAAGYWTAIVRAFVRSALDVGLPLPASGLPRELTGLADSELISEEVAAALWTESDELMAIFTTIAKNQKIRR